ncbi:hypothetical protein [Micromonospora sp. NPDC048830]|uniref:hypothetical protein n=1 Tax=Micromonospora sp. NPDC048830 TaxID=3364257 RepID=UPI00371F40BF
MPPCRRHRVDQDAGATLLLGVWGGALADRLPAKPLPIVAGLAPGTLSFAAVILPVATAAVVIDTSVGARVQLDTDFAMRGRVLAALGVTGSLSAAVGAPLLGWLAEHTGPRQALLCWPARSPPSPPSRPAWPSTGSGSGGCGTGWPWCSPRPPCAARYAGSPPLPASSTRPASRPASPARRRRPVGAAAGTSSGRARRRRRIALDPGVGGLPCPGRPPTPRPTAIFATTTAAAEADRRQATSALLGRPQGPVIART